jgi:C4-dicarboxylate-specific signal transduction histidine kinase
MAVENIALRREDDSTVSALRARFVMDELRADLRHDLRNDLAAIRNAAFYLRRKTHAEARDLWERERNVERMFDLIESQAGASQVRLETTVGAPVAGRTRVADLITFAARSIPRDVTVSIAERSDAWVAGDAAELQIALGCLVANAIDAVTTPVSDASTSDDAPPSSRRLRLEQRETEDGGVDLAVVDAGSGLAIPADEALRRFSTTKPGHFGIGLNVAQRIAARCGGALTIGPGEDGRGCRAVLILRGAP